MVGRELHTMCPLGEDHQGDDQGRDPTENGTFHDPLTMIVSRNLTLTMTHHKASVWSSTTAKPDLFQMNFILTV